MWPDAGLPISMRPVFNWSSGSWAKGGGAATTSASSSAARSTVSGGVWLGELDPGTPVDAVDCGDRSDCEPPEQLAETTATEIPTTTMKNSLSDRRFSILHPAPAASRQTSPLR